jgi:hypothetical protein
MVAPTLDTMQWRPTTVISRSLQEFHTQGCVDHQQCPEQQQPCGQDNDRYQRRAVTASMANS